MYNGISSVGKREAIRVNLGQHLVGSLSPNLSHDVTQSHSSPTARYSDGVIGVVGSSCEAPVKVEGIDCQALLDIGTVISSITQSLCQQLQLPIHPCRM